MKKWYEYNIKERYENIYKKFSIEDFWKWWSDGEDTYMEIRVKGYPKMKQYADAYNVPFSISGLFIHQDWQLKKIIKYFKDKSTIWFGINPKRQLRNKQGFASFSGRDINISKIKFLFLDIDRVLKDGQATNEDLMNADFLAEKILEELGNGGFNKNYCKICSGNGVQLLIKLDVPIDIPVPDFNEETNSYTEDVLFNEAKSIIHKGIGKILPTFSKQFRDAYNVEVDASGFNMGRIGALPYSYNLKYDQPIIRGIIELKNEGVNEGFSDYLRSIYLSSDVQKAVKKNFKQKTELILSSEHKMIKNELNRNVIVDLMMNYRFPDGGINNTLWYGIKILLHDSGIDLSDPGYKQIHSQLKSIHDRGFTENGLEPAFKGSYDGPFRDGDLVFVPSMVNKYLRLHPIQQISSGKTGHYKPIFPVSPRGKRVEKVFIDISPKIFSAKPHGKYNIIKVKEDPLKDLTSFSQQIYKIRRGEGMADTYKEGPNTFTDIGKIMMKRKMTDLFIEFAHAFREKWGDGITAYMMRYYMHDYLNCRRW